MTDDRKTRLCRLGPEVLADAILILADQYDEADKLVERLLAPADSAEARIKGEINALKRECQNYAWNAGRALAIRMRMLLSDIASSIHDAQTGVDLMLRFYETDAAIFECCDDSNGDVGDIYRNEAPELFVRYAKVFSNRSELLTRIKTLVSADEYGVRDSLLECADAWMTPLEMRLLADDSAACAKQESDRYRQHCWFRMAETMARLLKDGGLFEQLRRAATGELGAAARVDVAEVYLAGGDYAKALDMLEPVVDNNVFQQSRCDELRMQIYQHTGQDADAHALAWAIFYRCRGMVGLENLLKVIGESRRDEIVTQEVERIQASQVFSTADADFMIQTGHVDECARYIERHADQINGQNYYWLPRLADTLQSHGHLLAAAIVFRALLVSLLERGHTKAYRHGVRYLRQLEIMAPGIVDWGEMLDHVAFRQYLQNKHGRKHSFWKQVQEA